MLLGGGENLYIYSYFYCMYYRNSYAYVNLSRMNGNKVEYVAQRRTR